MKFDFPGKYFIYLYVRTCMKNSFDLFRLVSQPFVMTNGLPSPKRIHRFEIDELFGNLVRQIAMS